jgi:hypothetical protein
MWILSHGAVVAPEEFSIQCVCVHQSKAFSSCSSIQSICLLSSINRICTFRFSCERGLRGWFEGFRAGGIRLWVLHSTSNSVFSCINGRNFHLLLPIVAVLFGAGSKPSRKLGRNCRRNMISFSSDLKRGFQLFVLSVCFYLRPNKYEKYNCRVIYLRTSGRGPTTNRTNLRGWTLGNPSQLRAAAQPTQLVESIKTDST